VPINTLSDRLKIRRRLNGLCAEAVQQQIQRGEAAPTHLRNRRRHLARQVLKRIPHVSRFSAKRLLHAATVVLAMWGFGGITAPQQAQAAPVFKHVTLAGFDVGDYAAPAFADIDGDGDLDAFVGEKYGTVKFYRNNGTNTAPNFAADAAGNPLAGVGVFERAAPTFADIDNDGDLDAFVGDITGTVKLYRNTGTSTVPVFTPTGTTAPNTGQPVVNPLAPGGVPFNVGSYAVPRFADIDGDGDLDAFVGEYRTIHFYRNTGTSMVPVFTPTGATDPNTGQPVVNPLTTYNIISIRTFFNGPTFADIDNDGDFDLFLGASNGPVLFYRNTGTATVPAFTQTGGTDPNTGQPVVNPLAAVYVGTPGLGNGYATPTFADIDGDGDLDAFVGEFHGTVKVYDNTGTNMAPNFVAVAGGNSLNGFDVGSSAKPTFADIDGDGDLDAFVGESLGTVKVYGNTGTNTAPNFVAVAGGNPLAGFDVGTYAAPTFADIDNDGDLDAFVGESLGTVKFYENTGSATAALFTPAGTTGFNGVTAKANPLAGFYVGTHTAPTFADIDNDGDLDAFVGELNGTVKFYRNYSIEDGGTASAPRFVAVTGTGNPLAGFYVGGLAAPTFADIDHDGDLDAFVGEILGTVKFYRNNGPAAAPVFAADPAGNPLAGFDVGGRGALAFADIDNDGDFDAFVGEVYGTVQFFENFDPSPVTVADSVTTTEVVPVTTSDVTANDQFKAEGPAANFTITAFTQGASGTVAQVVGTNTFTYTPNTGFTGTDAFAYTLDDGAGNTAVGTVNVTVNTAAACIKSGYVSRVTVKPGAQNSTIFLRPSSLASNFFTFTAKDTKLIKAAVKSLPGRTFVQIKGNADCTTATSGGAAQFVIVAP